MRGGRRKGGRGGGVRGRRREGKRSDRRSNRGMNRRKKGGVGRGNMKVWKQEKELKLMERLITTATSTITTGLKGKATQEKVKASLS